MKTETKDAYRAGNVMILELGHGDREPQKVEIERVTKTQIVVKLGTRTLRFKRAISGWHEGPVCHEKVTSSKRRWDSAWLFDFSDEVWEERQKAYEQRKQSSEKKRLSEEKRQQDIADREAEELEEVKSLFAGRALIPNHVQRNADGSRLYVVQIPVKKVYEERKKGWQTAMILCLEEEEPDWKAIRETVGEPQKEKVMKKVLRYEATTLDGSGQQCSHGGRGFESDEAALWEAVRRAYHSW